MQQIAIRDDFIKLGQAMKLGGLAGTGAEAAELIAEGAVTIGGEAETRRGKKLYVGDRFEFDGETYEITSR